MGMDRLGGRPDVGSVHLVRGRSRSPYQPPFNQTRERVGGQI